MIESLSPLEIGMNALLGLMVGCFVAGVARALLVPVSRGTPIQFVGFRSFENADRKK